MKNNKIATYALLGGLAVAGLGAGAATMAYADPSAQPSAPASASPNQPAGQGGRHGRGKQGAEDDTMAKDLTTKLGLDQTKVSDALKAIRQEEHGTAQQNRDQNGQRGQNPDPAVRQADLAKKLAAKLGADESKVTTALDEIQQQRRAGARTALKTRLDTAVKDGKLTQADGDSVLKAADAGVIGAGGHR